MAPRWCPPLSAAAARLLLLLLLHPAASLEVVTPSRRSVSAFSATVPALLSNAGECDLCGGEQQWLFILSTGHSGSTSLMETLNTIPGFYIAGENFGMMDALMEEYESLGKIVKRSEKGEPGWQVRPISSRHVLCSLQTVMRTAIGEFSAAGTSVIGFKETRHTTAHQLDFFKKVFPCARIILSSRSHMPPHKHGLLQLHDDSGKDGNADHDKTLLKQLQNATNEFDAWQDRHPDDAYTMRMQDLDVKGMNDLLSWLDVKGCKFTKVPGAGEEGTAKLHKTGAGCRVGKWG